MGENGPADKPTLDEVMASIRRSLSEDPSPPLTVFSSDEFHDLPSLHGEADPDDFILPSLFQRSSVPDDRSAQRAFDRRSVQNRTTERPAPSRGSAGGLPTAARSESAAAPGPAADDAPLPPRVAETPLEAEVPLGSGGPPPSPHCQMQAMTDRVLARMGQPGSLTLGSAPVVAEPLNAAPTGNETAPPPDLDAERSSVPAGQMGSRNFLLGTGAADDVVAGEDAAGPLASAQPTTEGAAANPLGMAVDGETAELLRPLLRQWLDNNMKEVFARALHIEAEAKSNEPPKA
jgi:cell pole-organizing protein PopZ